MHEVEGCAGKERKGKVWAGVINKERKKVGGCASPSCIVCPIIDSFVAVASRSIPSLFVHPANVPTLSCCVRTSVCLPTPAAHRTAAHRTAPHHVSPIQAYLHGRHRHHHHLHAHLRPRSRSQQASSHLPAPAPNRSRGAPPPRPRAPSCCGCPLHLPAHRHRHRAAAATATKYAPIAATAAAVAAAGCPSNAHTLCAGERDPYPCNHEQPRRRCAIERHRSCRHGTCAGAGTGTNVRFGSFE